METRKNTTQIYKYLQYTVGRYMIETCKFRNMDEILEKSAQEILSLKGMSSNKFKVIQEGLSQYAEDNNLKISADYKDVKLNDNGNLYLNHGKDDLNNFEGGWFTHRYIIALNKLGIYTVTQLLDTDKEWLESKPSLGSKSLFVICNFAEDYCKSNNIDIYKTKLLGLTDEELSEIQFNEQYSKFKDTLKSNVYRFDGYNGKIYIIESNENDVCKYAINLIELKKELMRIGKKEVDADKYVDIFILRTLYAKSLDNVATLYNITRERVRQIQNKTQRLLISRISQQHLRHEFCRLHDLPMPENDIFIKEEITNG